MERFSGAIQSAYEEHECPPNIHEALGRLIERKVPKIDGYLLSPVSSLPSKVADVLQFGTRRTIDLTESSIREINREQVISSCLLVRGVLETACLMWDLTRRVTKDVRAGTDLTDLNTKAANALLGSGRKAKTFKFFENHVAQNILTIIQRLDKELDAPFEGFYEGLSEHAHPNVLGMMLVYAETHKACVTTFTDKKGSRVTVSLSLALGALASSLAIVEKALEEWEEVKLDLILLAEKQLHEKGTWPTNVPYPIPRRSDGSFPTTPTTS